MKDFILSARTVLASQAIVWIMGAFLTVTIFIPNTDDVFYFLPAMGLSTSGVLAVPLGGEWHYIFHNIPAFAFLQGLLLELTNLLGVPIDFYTYRLFAILIVAGMLWVAAKLIQGWMPVASSQQIMTAQAVFLSCLFLTPFAHSWFVVRPEILSLLALFASVLCYQRHARTDKWHWFILSGLAMSLAACLHPHTAMVAFLMFLVTLLFDFQTYQKLWRVIAYAVLSGLFFLPLIWFYGEHYPGSVAQITAQLPDAELRAGRSLSFILDYIFLRAHPEKTMLAQAAFSFYYFVLLLLVMLSGLGVIRMWRSPKTDLKSPRTCLKLYQLTALWLGIVAMMFFSYGLFYSFLVMAALATIVFATTFGPDLYAFSKQRLPFFVKPVIGLGLILAVGSWPATHVLKFKLTDSQYVHPHDVMMTLKSVQGAGDTLILTEPEFVPYFFAQLHAQYGGATENVVPEDGDVLWLFPTSGRPATEEEDDWSRRYVSELFERRPQDTLWMLSTLNTTYRALPRSNPSDVALTEACLTFLRSSIQVGIIFSEQQVHYDVKDTRLIRPVSYRFGCEERQLAELN